MTVKMADQTKKFMALANGLSKRQYFTNTELTDSVLKEEIYPDVSQEIFDGLLSKCSGLMKSMISADMDMTQLEAFLTAQIKKKENALSEEEAVALRKFWKTNKIKIHDSIVSQTIWGNTLEKVAWRVDLKSQSKTVEQINTPTAIMELHIADNLKKNSEAEVVRFELDEEKVNENQEAEVVRFELDEEKVNEMLSNMQEIETQINKFTQK